MDQGAARALDRDTHGEAVTATKPVTTPATKTDRRENPVFLRRNVDEYGFTLIEFRIVHRIQRREDEVKGCFESAPSMARDFGVSEKTVTRVLMVLSAAKVIRE
jgi:hypothetical protein